MDEALRVILLNLLTLSEQNSNAIEQVLMLDVAGLSQPEKDERFKVLESIKGIQDGCKKTLTLIESHAT